MHVRRHAWARLLPALALLASLVAPADVRAASKVRIASIGDQAPGGGQFLGSSLTGAPSAAGAGWVAFRTRVTDGSTQEQIVVTKLAGQEQRHVVAALGQSAGKRGDDDLGTFKQFLGRPTVNANGDVAFVAALTNSDALPGGIEGAGRALPAGVFLYERPRPGQTQGSLRVIALSRDEIPDMGMLDLTTTVDPFQESESIDLLERTPGLNDAGDVAFAAVTQQEEPPFREGGGIFVGRVGVAPTPRVRFGDGFNGGAVGVVGAPAINAAGDLAFRATVDGEMVDGQEVSFDGIFTLRGATLTRVAKDGDLVLPSDPGQSENVQQLLEFGVLVSLNDAGDVAFTSGGMFDVVTFTSTDLEFGSLVVRAGGTPQLVTFPGRPAEGFGRVRSGELGPDGGGEIAPPHVLPDGSVYVFAELTGGNGQAFYHANPPTYGLNVPIVLFGGSHPDPSPLGGVYFAAVSGPAVDAGGNVAFFARLAGAPVLEALVFRPTSGTVNSIVVGEATPTKGRFGGPPFAAPVINESGTVVFKSAVAQGPSSLGFFRWRRDDPEASRLAVLVRTGDAAPLPGAPLIRDLPGEASLNAAGDIAFTALVAGVGRAVLTLGPAGLRVVAKPNDPVPPGPPDALIETVGPSPLMMADGSVVFRGSFAYEDPLLFDLEREEAIFRVDPAGTMTLLARTTQESPAGAPFFRFRDPSTNGSMVVVRAPIGRPTTEILPELLPVGFFLIDPATAIRTVVMDDHMVGGSIKLDALVGRSGVDAAGNVVFLGRVGVEERTVLGRQAADGTSSVLALVGGLGPAGGTYRSVGRPAMSPNGHVAYRGNFERFGGGTGGFFLVTDAGPSPFIQIGEPDDDGTGGRLTSLNPTAALNAADNLVFVGSASAGKARNGIYVAAPTRTSLSSLAIRWKEKIVDQIPTELGSARGRVTLEFGDLGRPIQPDKQAVAIVVSDAAGAILSATVPKGGLVRRRGGFGLKKRVAGLKSLKLQKLGKNGARLTFSSRQFEFPIRAFGELVSPLSVRVDVGAHSGTAVVTCDTPPRGGATCGGS
jgi:hypothetical protein